MIDLNKIYNEDCIGEKGMCLIPDKSVDMILCDLPYGTTQCSWDVIIPFNKLWDEYLRIIKNDGVIALFASQPFTSLLVMSNIKMFKYEWIWHKNKGGNPLNAKRIPMKQHESVLIFYNKCKYFPQMEERTGNENSLKRIKYPVQRGRYRDDKVYGNTDNKPKTSMLNPKRYPQSVQFFEVQRGLHPTQKPVNLCEYLIKTYTLEGETILDNCIGSGSTAIACMNTNRNYIGFENDLVYYDLCIKRIESHKNIK